jgi:hypothetical protein
LWQQKTLARQTTATLWVEKYTSDMLNDSYATYYSPHKYITVDEITVIKEVESCLTSTYWINTKDLGSE